MKKEKAANLPPETAAEYELVNYTGGAKQFWGPKFGDIDVRNISPSQAETLLRRGWTKIRKKPVAKAAVPKDDTKKEK